MQVRQRSSSGPPPTTVVVVVLLFVAAAAGAWWVLRGQEESPPPPTPERTQPDAARALRSDSLPALEIPPLSASDAFLRDVAATLSENPTWASWLVTDDMALRFVRAAAALAFAESPAEPLDFLAPAGDFAVRDAEGGLEIDPTSYSRYDLTAETFVSMSTEGTAGLYRQLLPLFEDAYRELGLPSDRSVDDLVARAVDTLLEVEIPSGPHPVEPSRAVYAYVDADLEARSPAAKHLMRMGPENARRVQEKLRALRAAIWAG